MVTLILFCAISATPRGPMSTATAIKEIGTHLGMLPRGSYATLPLVYEADRKLILSRLIYMERPIPKQGTLISAPTYIASYDLSNGTFIALKKHDLELKDLPPPPWTNNRPRFASPSDQVAEFERIWQLYDVLVPAFANKKKKQSRIGSG